MLLQFLERVNVMPFGNKKVSKFFISVLRFLKCRPNWKDKLLRLAGLIVLISSYGCAAGQGLVASYEDEASNCAELEYVLAQSQVRLQKLESTDSTERDMRNFILGVGGFILPPLGIINATLLITDSYAADYTEKKVLKNRYNDMVIFSQSQGCGSNYALIPLEGEIVEPNA